MPENLSIAKGQIMRGRFIKARYLPTTLIVAVGALAVWVLAASGQPLASASQAAAIFANNSVVQATNSYTVYLPLITNCYPEPQPDPYFSSQGDMAQIQANDAWADC